MMRNWGHLTWELSTLGKKDEMAAAAHQSLCDIPFHWTSEKVSWSLTHSSSSLCLFLIHYLSFFTLLKQSVQRSHHAPIKSGQKWQSRTIFCERIINSLSSERSKVSLFPPSMDCDFEQNRCNTSPLSLFHSSTAIIPTKSKQLRKGTGNRKIEYRGPSNSGKAFTNSHRSGDRGAMSVSTGPTPPPQEQIWEWRNQEQERGRETATQSLVHDSMANCDGVAMRSR